MTRCPLTRLCQTWKTRRNGSVSRDSLRGIFDHAATAFKIVNAVWGTENEAGRRIAIECSIADVGFGNIEDKEGAGRPSSTSS